MRLLPDGNVDIDVFSEGQVRTYRTLDVLQDKGSRQLLGKATRVWRAVRIEVGKETGPVVVLKDCWVNPTIPREGENIRRIRKAILAQNSQSATRFFLDVVWDGDVLANGDVKTPDFTLPFASKIAVIDQEQHTRPESAKAVTSNRLIHYRIALLPVGNRSVHQETSLPTIYRALSNAASGTWLISLSEIK